MTVYVSPVAAGIPFDNSSDGFQSNLVQGAIEEALASAGGLQPYYLGTGLVVNYKAGRAWINGSAFILTAGSITVGASLTSNFIYMNLAGTIASGASIPSNGIPIAQFTSSATAITSLSDIRGSINNNVQFGLSTDISTNQVSNVATAGSTNRFADAGHIHPLVFTSSEVTDTTTATTTSATLALLTSMTLTVTPGKYLTFFSAAINVSNAGSTATVALFNNGVQDTGTTRVIAPFDGGALSVANATGMAVFQRIVTVTAGSLTVQWATSGGTTTCISRTLTALRIG